jgi:cyclopropane fatty-acyl-phospholipid synthase-like methyltransferase
LKSANDPKADYKELVRRGYDRCAEDYNAGRQKEADYLGPLIDKLSPGARVLDIGCGGGRPVCSELAKCFQVTGVDISIVQIELAKQSVPTAEFLCGDIMCQEFPPSHFDAITSFYTIFHLPKEEHAELFARVHRWLRPGGYFMCTLGVHDEAPYTEDDFFGVTMYWSNFGHEGYRRMLETQGFRIVADTELASGFEDGPAERHPLLLMQKPSK